MITGLGVDIVKNERLESAINRWGEKLLQRIFTEDEREYVSKQKNPIQSLSARFACKEAVAKALGTGISNGIRWVDIEVVSSSQKKPEVKLHGKAFEQAEKMEINNILVSFAHEKEFSVASVILLSTCCRS